MSDTPANELTPSDLPLRMAVKISIHPVSGCWEWNGKRTQKGYGVVRWARKERLVHRVSYTLLVDIIPDGLDLDHVKLRGCIFRHCCNPAHLEPVTNAENHRRARLDECRFGHRFVAENTYIRPNGDRLCRECCRARERGRVRDPEKAKVYQQRYLERKKEKENERIGYAGGHPVSAMDGGGGVRET